MKFLFSFLFVIIFSIPSFSQTDDTTAITTYYFIRHAEKNRSDASNKNPHLNDLGKIRAENWNAVFSHIKFDAIYSTNYNRTKETAQPTAIKNKLELILYHPFKLDKKVFLNDTKGKTVLVVGHSNTTPQFVNTILGTDKYEMIDDNNNGNLYTVTIISGKTSDRLLVIN